MMVEKKRYKLNRLETTRLIGPLVDRHWAELREAKERGEKVAWCSGPLFIFPYAMGMKCHFMAGYAAYCAGRKAGDQVLEAAEADGELMDTCSYHRLHTGMAAAILRGHPVKKEVILPIPDLLIIGRLCTEMAHYAEALHRRLGIPVVAVDFPPPRRKEDLPRLERFVVRQIKENLIPTLEKVCGKEFDEEGLRRILRVLKEAATIRNQCWEFFKLKPTPWTLWDYGVSIAPVFYMMGKPETVPYYKALLCELKERAEKKIPAADGEKYRLYWDGWLPWAFLGMFIRKFVSYGAVPICGRYPWEFFPHPEYIDPDADDVVQNWVELYYTKAQQAAVFMPEGALEEVTKLVEEYSIDGLVMFASRTCRAWNVGQQEIINEVERRLGVPGVVIEADMVDSRMVSEAQIETRLQALFETIDARRRRE